MAQPLCDRQRSRTEAERIRRVDSRERGALRSNRIEEIGMGKTTPQEHIDLPERPPSAFPGAAMIVLGLVIAAGLYAASVYSYLLFHVLIEGLTIALACGMFIVVWNSRRVLENDYILLLGVAYLFIGGLHFVHTLAYKGMGVFPGHGANLATQLWVGARYVEALTLLFAPLAFRMRLRPGPTLAAYAAGTALLLAAIFGGVFPDCFVEPDGLTPFKVASEYIMTGLLIGAAVTLRLHRSDLERGVFRLFTAGILIAAAAEMMFTLYLSPYGPANLLGHLLKLASVYLLYRAVLVSGLKRPYDLLSGRLNESEARYRRLFTNMTEAFALHDVITDERGQPCDYVFIAMNPAFERLTGLKRNDIIGRRVLDVLPGTEHFWIETYGRVALTGEPAHIERYSAALGRWFEVYAYQTVRGQFAVLFTDVTDRKEADQALKDLNAELENRVADRTAEAERRAEQLQRVALDLSTVEERERERLAHVLHDDLQQTLAYAKLRAGMLARSPDASNEVSSISNDLVGALSEAIETSRSLSHELSPALLHNEGLGPALQRLADNTSDRYALETSVEVGDNVFVLSREQRTFAYRAAQELVLNAVKHADARRIRFELWREDHTVKMAVEDDGVGLGATRSRGERDKDDGIGLLTVEEKAKLRGGSLQIISKPERGSRFVLTLPVLNSPPG